MKDVVGVLDRAILGQPNCHVDHEKHEYGSYCPAPQLDPAAPAARGSGLRLVLDVQSQPANQARFLAANPFLRARSAAASTCRVDTLPNFGEKSVGFESARCKRIKMQSLLVNLDFFVEANLCDGDKRLAGISNRLDFNADDGVTGYCQGQAIFPCGAV